VIPPAAGSTVSIAEDVAGSPFGFKLIGASATSAGTTVAGPAGSPPGITANVTSNPSPGDQVRFDLKLPDGSTETITLTATASSTPGPNEFTIGANPAATAANLQSALTGSVGKLARTALSAASVLAAANDFFNIDVGQPPQRVAGPPFDTATALVAGTPADTVFWYTGEMGSDPARSTAVARVDQSLTVSYGVRGNEEAIRATVQNIAAFAAITFSPSDPDAADRYAALTTRVAPALDGPPGQQKLSTIQAELAGAQTTLSSAQDRQKQTTSTLQDLLQSVDGISDEEVSAQILALQTRLQASLQTTAMLSQISLVDYL
jgi:hypothetical protein